MSDVIAVGELLIDFTYTSADGYGYPVMAAHPGGAPANFLAALAKFGASCDFIGKVGDDAFGRRLVATLGGLGIGTTGLIVDPDAFTTLAFVTLDENGDRDFSFARKPGADTRLNFDEIDLSLIDGAKAFHFGTLSLTDEPSRSAVIRAARYAREKGKLVTCDPNLRLPLWRDGDSAREAMRLALSLADVVKISDDEVSFLFGCAPEEGARKIMADFGASLVFVTCGADGCYFANANACGFVPALSGVKVADTTGAGDIFGGSAVWKLLGSGLHPSELTGEELRDIASFACAAASLSTERPGGIYSVPSLAEIAARTG